MAFAKPFQSGTTVTVYVINLALLEDVSSIPRENSKETHIGDGGNKKMATTVPPNRAAGICHITATPSDTRLKSHMYPSHQPWQFKHNVQNTFLPVCGVLSPVSRQHPPSPDITKVNIHRAAHLNPHDLLPRNTAFLQQ